MKRNNLLFDDICKKNHYLRSEITKKLGKYEEDSICYRFVEGEVLQPPSGQYGQGDYSFMKADVLPEQVGIAVPAEAWGTDVLVLTDEQKAELKAQAEALL